MNPRVPGFLLIIPVICKIETRIISYSDCDVLILLDYFKNMTGFNYISFKKTFLLFIPNIFKNKRSGYCALVAIVLILIDIVIASLLLPYYSQKIANSFSVSLLESLGLSIMVFGCLWTLEKIIAHLQEIIFFPAINHNIQKIAYRVVESIHQIPLALYQNLSIPEVVNAIRRISQSARAFIKICFLLIIPAAIKVLIAVYSAAQFAMSGFILIPVFLGCLLVLYKGTQWYVRTREASWQLSDKVMMRVHDSLLNTKISRFCMNEEMATIGNLLQKEANLWQQTNTRLHLVHIIIALILGMTITLILYQAFNGAWQQNQTIGGFLLLKTQLIAAFLPFKQLAVEFRQLAEASIDIKKVIQILELPKEQQPHFNNSSLENSKMNPTVKSEFVSERLRVLSKGQILQCQSITFGYVQENLILKELSLNILQGETAVILGENGSGKSSLLRLLSGLELPQQGEVKLKGRNIQEYSKNESSRILHYIPQDLRLFNMSLRDNISYGFRKCPDTLILQAIEKVDLFSLLKQLPDGLDSAVGEMGTFLSGGEIQRIALARALIREPEILLLDETLHSLDIEGEKKMLAILNQVIPTIILVSHRPSTLSLVNRAYRIFQGKISEIILDTQSRISIPPSTLDPMVPAALEQAERL